jgi:hypothetical protein
MEPHKLCRPFFRHLPDSRPPAQYETAPPTPHHLTVRTGESSTRWTKETKFAVGLGKSACGFQLHQKCNFNENPTAGHAVRVRYRGWAILLMGLTPQPMLSFGPNSPPWRHEWTALPRPSAPIPVSKNEIEPIDPTQAADPAFSLNSIHRHPRVSDFIPRPAFTESAVKSNPCERL